MRTNTDITLYNRYIDPTTRSELFQRTVILDVAFVEKHGSTILQAGGLVRVDVATAYIPMVRGTFYKEPSDWLALLDKTGYWTLHAGDYFCTGAVLDELHPLIPAIISPPSDAIPAFGPSDLKAKYWQTFTILSVDANDRGSLGMQFWTVAAK
jgi:hypothetical protein